MGHLEESCQARLNDEDEEALLEQEAANEVDHSLITELPKGLVITNPNY